MDEFKVLITTSGIGSRLGALTDYTNKSLVRVGSKPAITRIIETYPRKTSFVVTLGYFGNHVKEYLKIAHPDRLFTFVEVDKFSGPGSSQLYSMRCAKDHLQCPFIFHACDTLAEGKLLSLDTNWVAAAKVDNADQYRTLKTNSSLKFEGFNQKGEMSFDYAYPGICGIKDYYLFWDILEEILATARNKNLSDCDVINKMIDHFQSCDAPSFKIVKLEKWYDIGNVSELERTRSNFEENFDVLDKPRENIFFLENSVIKFFHDSTLVHKRVERAATLSGLVPKLESSSEHFFKYEFVDGDLFSTSATPTKMRIFLKWASENMWSKRSEDDITHNCYEFYFEKTHQRILQLLDGVKDNETFINGELVPPIQEMISLIDSDWLCAGIPTTIHGDLILDNVIETIDSFVLIDWRQDFANRLDVGDLYYDLAKLNHNLIFNHELVKLKHYSLEHQERNILCDILCRKMLLDCKEVLHDFIEEAGYDLSKVKLLTSLIWINMSPLHEHPLNKFLFNFGKYNLFRCLKQQGKL